MGGTVKDFYRLVVEDVPLIDVRAPAEFAAGAFPTAVNLPLMNDEERHRVGICYKQAGQDAAIALGHMLVCGEIKERRIAAWEKFVREHPNACIYCSRGGLRSRLSQEWVEAAVGHEVPRLEGGFKAFRQYLIARMNPDWLKSVPLVLGGRTGSGKTRLLRALDDAIDLEGLARHRGSAFGHFIKPQPTQIDFENNLVWRLIQHEAAGKSLIVVEDEGRHIGSRNIPSPLAGYFFGGEVVLLETPLEERVQNILDEYVTSDQKQYAEAFGEDALFQWLEHMRGNISKIRKRLGNERMQRVLRLLNDAFERQVSSNDVSAHAAWIRLLLTEYYDPMYDYQIEQKRQNIVFRGGAKEVLEYIRNRSGEKKGVTLIPIF